MSGNVHCPLIERGASKKPETMPKDWSHVEEAIEIVNWVLSHCMVDRISMEKTAFQYKSTSWLDFPQVFTCHISYVILTDIILTVLETLEYPNLLNICISYLLGLSSRLFNLARFSSKIPNADTYPSEVKMIFTTFTSAVSVL